jgi:hypothetical protein
LSFGSKYSNAGCWDISRAIAAKTPTIVEHFTARKTTTPRERRRPRGVETKLDTKVGGGFVANAIYNPITPRYVSSPIESFICSKDW